MAPSLLFLFCLCGCYVREMLVSARGMGMVPLSREGRRFKNLFSFFLDTLEGNRMSQAKFARLIALMRPLLKKRNGHPPTKKEEKLETPPHPTLPFPPWDIKFRPVVATLTQRWEDKVALPPP